MLENQKTTIRTEIAFLEIRQNQLQLQNRRKQPNISLKAIKRNSPTSKITDGAEKVYMVVNISIPYVDTLAGKLPQLESTGKSNRRITIYNISLSAWKYTLCSIFDSRLPKREKRRRNVTKQNLQNIKKTIQRG